MEVTPTEITPGTESWFLFKELGNLSDSFLERHRGHIREYVDTLVGKLPANTADIDTWWWLTAIKIALEEPIRDFRRNLGERYQSYADYGLEKSVPYEPTKGLMESHLMSAATGMDIKTRESILNGLRGPELGEAIRDAVEKEVKEFIDALDTVFSIHDRIAMRELGDELGRTLWVYAGPADNRNRAFCGDIVRRDSVFTMSGIEKLNEHPDLHAYVPPNVFTMCGGHGCRHLWIPVANGSPIVKERTVED